MADMKTRLKRVDVPEIDVGAPTPTVYSDESRLLFGYYVQRRRVDEPSDTCAIVSVDSCTVVKFGYPNEEAINGHRYAPIGLTPYNAYEVLGSEWIQEIVEANRVHPHHTDRMFASCRHFIFPFHDSVLEFITNDELVISRSRGELRDLIYAEACREAAARRAHVDSLMNMRQDDLAGSSGNPTKQRDSSPFGKLLGFFGWRYPA